MYIYKSFNRFDVKMCTDGKLSTPPDTKNPSSLAWLVQLRKLYLFT
jgi:hypothetical protein